MSTVKQSNLNKISNRTKLSRTSSILSRRIVPELFRIFLIIFVFFCKNFGSVRSNRINQLNIIQYLHHQNASYSAYFEVRFDRTKLFIKKTHEQYELVFNSVRQTLKLRQFHCTCIRKYIFLILNSTTKKKIASFVVFLILYKILSIILKK